MEESHNEDNTGSLSVNKTESVIYSTVNAGGTVGVQGEGAERKRGSNQLLIIVLAVLGVVIVGLVIGIVVASMASEEDLEDSVMKEIEESDGCAEFGSAVEVQVCVHSEFSEDGDVNKMVAEYQTAIDKALEVNDYYSAVDLIGYRSDDLVAINRCKEALSILDDIDFGFFDIDSLLVAYSNASGTGASCGDEAARQKWIGLYSQLDNGE